MLRDTVSISSWSQLHLTDLITEAYLRDRPNAKFDSKDFDSLSNKFMSRLVLRDIRAN